MYTEICQVLIPKLLSEWTGAVISRSRVIDGLLDLRCAAGQDRELLSVIDGALGSVPGNHQVEVAWAVDVLAKLTDMARLAELAADASLAR